jgi:hypothetical protein
VAVEGIVILVFVLVGIFFGPMGDVLGGGNVAAKIVRIPPTYSIADGVFNDAQSPGSLGGSLLDLGVILTSALLLFFTAAWILRRRSAVAGSI